MIRGIELGVDLKIDAVLTIGEDSHYRHVVWITTERIPEPVRKDLAVGYAKATLQTEFGTIHGIVSDRTVSIFSFS